MSRATAGGTLAAIAGVLQACGYEVSRDRTGGGRLWCESACVARVAEDKVLLCAVLAGCDPTIEVMPDEPHAATPYTVDIKALAFACRLRILVRREEREKLATYRRAKLAGYVCPGAGCREALCDQHSRPAEVRHAA